MLFLDFFEHDSYLGVRSKLRSDYSCVARVNPPVYLHILHWIVESEPSKFGERKASLGVVSGINQRLALGIENQFVFATIHHAPAHLRVIAAIWRDDQVSNYILYFIWRH